MKRIRLLLLLALATACSASESTGVVAELETSETAAANITPIDGKSLDVRLTIPNLGSTPVTLSWIADCAGFLPGTGSGALVVRAYRLSGSARTLAWSSAGLPHPSGCTAQPIQRTLNPGDWAQLENRYDVATILGDTLPAGRYAITATAVTTPAVSREVDAGTVTLSTAVVNAPDSLLSGTWVGSTQGVTITLLMKWTADSVTGSGTYAVPSSNLLGCGGGTLTGSGTLRFAAARSNDAVGGGMFFDNGWDPPFGAVLADTTTLGGYWMSIDAGPCPVTFTKR